MNEGLFSESVMRRLLANYKSGECVSFYNDYVQEHLMKELDSQPCIHILDCTKVLVNLDNENYENSSVVKIDGENMRGYKLGVLRGVLDNSGIAEEVVFGTLSREMTNYLKTVRGVDTYIPARENMIIYQDAVKPAVASGKWQKHPNRKRNEQEIQLVTNLDPLWESDGRQKMSPLMPVWCMIKNRQLFCIYDDRHR